jgi:hypothetical protein
MEDFNIIEYHHGDSSYGLVRYISLLPLELKCYILRFVIHNNHQESLKELKIATRSIFIHLEKSFNETSICHNCEGTYIRYKDLKTWNIEL